MKGCWGQVCKHRAICRVSWVGTCSRVIYRSRCFLLIYFFFFSAEIVTLLRKCMQLVIKRVLCLLMLLTAERSLKVVVSILLKNTERMEAEIPVPINHVFRKLLHINILKPKRLVLKQNGFVQKFVISFWIWATENIITIITYLYLWP